MKKTTIEKVVSDLRVLFNLNSKDNNTSFEDKNKFLINKQDFERFETIQKLQNYFIDKVIDGGYLELSPITMVFTSFEVKAGVPK